MIEYSPFDFLYVTIKSSDDENMRLALSIVRGYKGQETLAFLSDGNAFYMDEEVVRDLHVALGNYLTKGDFSYD